MDIIFFFCGLMFYVAVYYWFYLFRSMLGGVVSISVPSFGLGATRALVGSEAA